MGYVRYNITSGYLPITASLLGAGVPDNIHTEYGEGVFTGVPLGNYVIQFTDAGGCIEFGNIELKSGETATTTTTTTPFGCVEYGLLYNWFAVDDTRKITSSDDWTIPTNAQWDALVTYVGGVTVAGGKLKQNGYIYWQDSGDPADEGTNDYGFNGRGAGVRNSSDGSFGSFIGRQEIWAADQYVFQTNNANFFYLQYNGTDSNTPTGGHDKNYGKSVRLMSDATGQIDGTITTYTGNDGQVYNAVAINGKYYTSENLIETQYRNGDPIPVVENAATWIGLSTGAMCAYGNDYNNVGCDFVPTTFNCVEYGLLYNWWAATDIREITSIGWHIPTPSDFDTLEAAIGGATLGGSKLKETGLVYWANGNTDATNELFFNGRGAGQRVDDGSFSAFRSNVYFWTTGGSGVTGYCRRLLSSAATFTFLGNLKKYGTSIRPVKDVTTLSDGEEGTYTGNDGKVYRTICIGTQEWLADNLMETQYRNGDPIPIIQNNATWMALTSGAMCAYDNDYNNVGCDFTYTTSTTTTQLPITTTTTEIPATSTTTEVPVTTTTTEPGTTTTTEYVTTTTGEQTTTTTAYFGETATYFVDATGGDDGNLGTSTGQAWQTISKVNGETFSPGDVIAFKAGEVWEETLVIPSSGTSGNHITFGAYGSGAKPIIYGSDEITGWSLYSGNIYSASYGTNITQLFVDGERMQLARYPNSGFFTIDATNGSTSIQSDDLDGGQDYSGATLIARTERWALETESVSSSSSTTLTVSDSYYDYTVGEGFFLLNKLIFLDEAGEWYYDSGTNTVYLWTPNGDSPDNYTVRGTIRDNGVTVDTKNYITLENLNIQQQETYGVYAQYYSYLTIDNCDILNQTLYGGFLERTSSDHATITNCEFSGQTQYALDINGDYAVLTNNTFRDIHQLKGFNTSPLPYISGGTAVRLNYANYSTFTYNKLYDLGKGGLSLNFSEQSVVQYNFFNNTNTIIDDDGAIHLFNTDVLLPGCQNTVISYNIIDGVPGNYLGSTDHERSFSYGIYVDDREHDITVEYNTVINATEAGVFLHNNRNNIVRYNTVYGSRYGLYVAQDGQGNSLTYNTIYALENSLDGIERPYIAGQRYYGTQSTFDYNIYIHHYYNDENFRKESTWYSFSEWKTETSQDANSTIDTTSFTTEEEAIFYNETSSVKTFYLNGATGVKDAVTGATITDSFNVAAWSSQIVYGVDLNLIEEGVAITTTSTTGTTTTTVIPTTTTTTTTSEPATTSTTMTTTTTYPVTTTTTGISLTDSLISVWELNEPIGTTVNDSYGSNDGTNTGATVNQPGLIGQSYLFSAGDVITIPWGSGINPYTQDYTINMWVRETDTGGSHDVIWEMGIGTGSTDLHVMKKSGGYWEFGVQNSSAFVSVGTILVAAEWQMVTLVLDSGTASLYVNGVFSGQKSYTSFSTAVNMDVGRDNAGSYMFDGYIDQFAVWSRALTTDELAILYNSGSGLAYSSW